MAGQLAVSCRRAASLWPGGWPVAGGPSGGIAWRSCVGSVRLGGTLDWELMAPGVGEVGGGGELRGRAGAVTAHRLFPFWLH